MAQQPIRFSLYQTDYNVGWRLQPNVAIPYQYKDEFDVVVKTNHLGLHDVEHNYQKPAGIRRIVLLGDSFAEGASVTIEQGFPYLLGQCLNRNSEFPVEVINMGVAYYATTEELFLFQHEGVRYEPDLVLLAFYVGNDIEAYSARESEDKWFDALGGYLITLDDQQQLETQWIDWQSPSPHDGVGTVELFLRQYSKLYYLVGHSNSKLRDWLKDYGVRVSWATPTKPPVDFRNNFDLMRYATDFPDGPAIQPKLKWDWQIITVALTQLQQASVEVQAQLGVVIIPESFQVNPDVYDEDYRKYRSRYGAALNEMTWDYQRPNQVMREWLTAQKIPALDLLPVYRDYTEQQQQNLYFKIDKHLNPTGHAVTAEAICQWIEQNQVLPGETLW
jgi:hypothetical protein